jgi:CelD/BcsL family acetyltransferase involved in cellulose biosynthesis
VKAEILRDWDRFFRLEPEWNALLARSHADTIFLRWEWIGTWAEIVARDVQPAVVVVRERDGTLAAVAPLYVSALRFLRTVRYRTLLPMGHAETGAVYPDLIVRADCEQEGVEAVFRALWEVRELWDCIWLPIVSGWTGAKERIVGGSEKNRFFCRVRPTEFAFLPLPGDYGTYLQGLSVNMRKQLRKEDNRFRSLGGVSVVQCSRQEDVPRFLEALFELHERRWASVGKAGAFRREPRQAEFYRRFIPLALERGWLRLYGLEDRGELKAVQIGYRYADVYHALQDAFDPAYAKGAGHFLRANVIKRCIGEGIKAVDFLAGLTEHKRTWLAHERAGLDVFVGRPGLKNRLLFAPGVWPTGRYLRSVDSSDGRSAIAPQ